MTWCRTAEFVRPGVPIPIPLIRRFLSPQQFNHLLEAAIASYIEQQPERFQYCTTADCKQVYLRGMGAHTCPSCFASICTACNKEVHEGMSCEEREVLGNLAEQERRNEQWALDTGTKRCPTCRVLVQKTEGCNHMMCCCGAHFCWIYLKVFDHNMIYRHLTSVHGGIDTPHVPQQIQVNQPVRENEQICAHQPVRANQDDEPAIGRVPPRRRAEEPRRLAEELPRSREQRRSRCIIM